MGAHVRWRALLEEALGETVEAPEERLTALPEAVLMREERVTRGSALGANSSSGPVDDAAAAEDALLPLDAGRETALGWLEGRGTRLRPWKNLTMFRRWELLAARTIREPETWPRARRPRQLGAATRSKQAGEAAPERRWLRRG